MTTVIDVINAWQEHVRRVGVTEHDIESLAERVDSEEVLGQRTGFDLTRLQTAPTKRQRTSPFRRD